MDNKELQVVTGPIGNQQSCIVVLNGVMPDERLTPKMARRAARVAHGSGAFATVWDNPASIGYRLYERSARKLVLDDGYEAQTTSEIASKLWDTFAAQADPDGIANLDLDILTQQIAELRADGTDDWPSLSHREIAQTLQEYARNWPG